MAANTQYTPAPQRDSMDAHHYTQAPPSYQDSAEPSSSAFGEPRSEDDNVPDDFKVGYMFELDSGKRQRLTVS